MQAQAIDFAIFDNEFNKAVAAIATAPYDARLLAPYVEGVSINESWGEASVSTLDALALAQRVGADYDALVGAYTEALNRASAEGTWERARSGHPLTLLWHLN